MFTKLLEGLKKWWLEKLSLASKKTGTGKNCRKPPFMEINTEMGNLQKNV